MLRKRNGTIIHLAEVAIYSLDGIEAYPADVLVSDDRVRVVERDSSTPLSLSLIGPIQQPSKDFANGTWPRPT